ncbi:AzlC family ABC transporter permease [Serratia nematodiphila]|uniref:AzlC family ABC transporter permease n=1 Tax=Enterobacteriaceae TaxID=543 RepID=UPI0017AAF6AE|nr:AzlC family ABC transporter permease [Klebsiella variicola]HAB5395162.1 branched-chain amino acid ABC transporter permease [Salmonella enterica subsp. enterica serovar Mbandaka]
MLTNRTGAFYKGLLASISIVAGYLPIAFSFGLAATDAGLSPFVTLLISVAVYAGASQFLMIALLSSGAGVITTVLSVLLLNGRHVFYGPALASRLPRLLPSPLQSFGLTDEVFSTAANGLEKVAYEVRPVWLLGLQLGAYAAWILGTVLGTAFVGNLAHWPDAVREALSFVLPALFFSLLLESGIRGSRLPAVVATGTAIAALFFLPGHFALLLAIVFGTAAHALRSIL